MREAGAAALATHRPTSVPHATTGAPWRPLHEPFPCTEVSYFTSKDFWKLWHEGCTEGIRKHQADPFKTMEPDRYRCTCCTSTKHGLMPLLYCGTGEFRFAGIIMRGGGYRRGQRSLNVLLTFAGHCARYRPANCDLMPLIGCTLRVWTSFLLMICKYHRAVALKKRCWPSVACCVCVAGGQYSTRCTPPDVCFIGCCVSVA